MKLELTRLDEKTIDRYAKFLLKKGKQEIAYVCSLTAGIILDNGNLIITIYDYESGLGYCDDDYGFAVITKDRIFIADEGETYNIINNFVKDQNYELPDYFDLIDFYINDEDKYENNMRKKYGFPEW